MYLKALIKKKLMIAVLFRILTKKLEIVGLRRVKQFAYQSSKEKTSLINVICCHCATNL